MNLKVLNRHKKNTWNHADLDAVRQPVPYCEKVPVPEFNNLSSKCMKCDQFHETIENSASERMEGSSKIDQKFQRLALSRN